MKSFSDHHPHIDPRYPRNKDEPGTNPPVFVWKALVGKTSGAFRLTVSSNAEFTDVVIKEDELEDPVFLPESAFPRGEYWWKWGTKASESTVFNFTILESATVLEIPPVSEWMTRFPTDRPRLYTRPDRVAFLRREREANPYWKYIRDEADELLGEEHTLEEPDYLPDREADYPAFRKAFFSAMWDSRRLARGAEILGLAWMCTGDTRYADACRQRILALCSWDPEGPTSIENNDEAHMSILWYGVSAADWVWDQFSPEQKKTVLRHVGKRAEQTFEHMHDLGIYGIDRFDSHAGREIVFLAWTLIAFYESIPGSERMLEWLRPVLCGIWPVWAEDDGSWAEGISYSLAYVTIMSRFAYVLRVGSDINLFKRPFWQGHAEWRYRCFPHYAQWIGFGDHSEAWRQTWLRNADLVELIGAMNDSRSHEKYVADLRKHAATLPDRALTLPYSVSCMSFFEGFPGRKDVGSLTREPTNSKVLSAFDGAGWAAIRTDLMAPEKDVAFIFRSSPYGSISHSHANNNDFIVHVAGDVMAMPSGYYVGYGSPHHANWVWHTKSHNCATLSGAPQKMRSYASRGMIRHPIEYEDLAYFVGIADESYDQFAKRCRRHVLFIKNALTFILVDEFVSKPDSHTNFEWNIHTWHSTKVDEGTSEFTIASDGGSSLSGSVLYRNNHYWTCTDGWEPPPQPDAGVEQRRMQYNIRFSTGDRAESLRLPVVLRAAFDGRQQAKMSWRQEKGAEAALIDDTTVRVFHSGPVIAAITCKGKEYRVNETGLSWVK